MGVSTDYLGHVEIVPNLNQPSMTTCRHSREVAGAIGPRGLTPSPPRTRTPEIANERCSATTKLLRDNLATGANGSRARTVAAWAGTGWRSSTAANFG